MIAWCLMGTHFHLVAECDLEQLSLAVHRLNCLYAMYFNRRHNRRGHLFENRFSAWVVWDEPHLESTVGYVLENPVRAGLCRQASEWRWSWPRLRADLASPDGRKDRGRLRQLEGQSLRDCPSIVQIGLELISE